MTHGSTERLKGALAGHYRIERMIGEGGMATVYLANDLKHSRKVALKVLRPELAAIIGAERFLSEIETTAKLQHPHILPLFDSGDAGGLLFYVMPYVEGESLRQRLDREHQLPVDEAVRVATNVAEALAYAHAAGVVHRDIKPANILLQAGKPVIADFGIALAVSGGGRGRLTETGLSLGTPHYMSPEQATGDQGVGAATDVWALGCVLYEMLVGEPPYTGSTPQAVLGKIVLAEPPSAMAVRKSVPANVDAAIRKALEKVPADRFGNANEFATALVSPAFRHGDPALGDATTARQGWTRRSGVLAGVALVASALAVFAWLARPAPPLADVIRVTIVPPSEASLDVTPSYPDLAISRDGRFIVYRSQSPEREQLHLRALGEFDASILRSAAGVAPVMSPDGAWLAFQPGDRSILQRVSVLGGAPVVLADSPTPIFGASWGADGQIVFGTANGGLYRVTAEGGAPEVLTTPDREQGEVDHTWPAIVDGRDAVVFVITTAGESRLSTGQLAVLDLGSGEVTRLGLAGVSPRYISTGHLVYAGEDGSIRAAPFDPESLTVTGATVSLLQGVAVKGTGAAQFDVSDDGRLVYVVGGAGTVRSLVWVDRAGQEEPIPAEPRPYRTPRLSPDGRRLALVFGGDLLASEIWVWSFVGQTLTPLSPRAGADGSPAWTQDGERIAYGNESGDVSWKSSNDEGAPESLAQAMGRFPSPYFFTPDGTALVVGYQDSVTSDWDLAMISTDGDASVRSLLNGPYNERNAELSTDGRWMAYMSDESGVFEVYVRPFPEVDGPRVQVSNNGGFYPLWSQNGSELFYQQLGAQRQIVSVSFDTESTDRTFPFREREVVMDWPYFTGPLSATMGSAASWRAYDASADGGRFLAIKERDAAGEAGSPEIHVVLNWFEELKERMGAR